MNAELRHRLRTEIDQRRRRLLEGERVAHCLHCCAPLENSGPRKKFCTEAHRKTYNNLHNRGYAPA